MGPPPKLTMNSPHPHSPRMKDIRPIGVPCVYFTHANILRPSQNGSRPHCLRRAACEASAGAAGEWTQRGQYAALLSIGVIIPL